MNKNSLESFELVFGKGTISAVFSVTLAILSLLAVLSFYCPTYLTTPELRGIYSESFARGLLFAGIFASAAFAVINVVLSKRVIVACFTFIVLMLTVLLGGYKAPVGTIQETNVYFGLDFFILNLLLFSFIFIFIEKLFGHNKKQLVFRREWHTDVIYFTFNHILIGIFLIIINSFVAQFNFAVNASLQTFIQSIHPIIQFLLVMLVADLVQYWSHRAYHEMPFLWKFHAVHHSSEEMDWIAGSRVHVVELLLTRALILLALVLLGFDQLVVNIYIAFVAFQAVFDHANVSVNPGLLKYIFVTPNFHHWHHSQDKEALDKNYSAHFSFLDYIFGTAVDSQKMWPEKYGVLGDYVPKGFIPQFLYPFKANFKTFKTWVTGKNIKNK
jgi:sterol desaturase/sphingolipid hydroxylase (fatty acid hydroxylase superfamily)